MSVHLPAGSRWLYRERAPNVIEVAGPDPYCQEGDVIIFEGKRYRVQMIDYLLNRIEVGRPWWLRVIDAWYPA